MKKAFKIIGIVFFCLTLVASLGVCGWYIYIDNYGPEKVISNTYELGLQTITNEDGEEEQKYFCEVKYNSNRLINGYESLDIKFNYMLDENQTDFYSQGLQYIAPKGGNLEFTYYRDISSKNLDYETTRNIFGADKYYNEFGSFEPNGEVFNYASGDDYETTILSSNPLGVNTRFKIQLGDELYMMVFKNANSGYDEVNFYQKTYDGWTWDGFIHATHYHTAHYAYYNYNFFTKTIYESIQSLPAGTDRALTFEFGDFFDYYQYTNGQFVETKIADSTLITKDIKNYYAIKVIVSDSGAQSAEDSIFKAFNGSMNYNNKPDSDSLSDYYIGRSYLKVDETCFDLVEIEAGYYVLKLKDSFVDTYSKFDTIRLKVVVNLDGFISEGCEIMGFALDSGLDKFRVESCQFAQTIDGQLVITEVAYV